MNAEQNPRGNASGPMFRILEYLTAGTLLLVLGVLAWITVAAYVPKATGRVVPDGQVVGAVVLLLAALALVSIVSLLHTRK